MGKNADKIYDAAKKRADEWKKLRIEQIKAEAAPRALSHAKTKDMIKALILADGPNLKQKDSVHIPNREHTKEERCHYCGKHHNVGRLVTINGTKEIRKVCPDCLIKALDLLLKGDVTIEIVEE